MMRRFLSSGALRQQVVKSEAFAQSATTLARIEKEKVRQALVQAKAGAGTATATGINMSADGAREKAVLLNRKTGQPLYAPQPVMSSAHVYRECKKTGAPMPAPALQDAQGPGEISSFMAPAALVLAIGAVVSFVAMGGTTAEPLTGAALSTSALHELSAGGTASLVGEKGNGDQHGVPDLDLERLAIMQQQPLWLQRQR